MSFYWVKIRGIAEQTLRVEADSKTEAREKAARADFDDAAGDPDWVTDEYGYRTWAAREAVEEEGASVPASGVAIDASP